MSWRRAILPHSILRLVSSLSPLVPTTPSIWSDRIMPKCCARGYCGRQGGKISRTTAGADRAMVVSAAPVVVGNKPAGSADNFATVAFVGQVFVRVAGPVASGSTLSHPARMMAGYCKAQKRSYGRGSSSPDRRGTLSPRTTTLL